MNKERIVWWGIFIISLIILYLSIFYMSLYVTSNPETFAFVFGGLGFWLFANRLIFGYGSIVDSINKFIEDKEIDKKKLAEKSHHHLLNLDDYSIPALFILWKGSIEPYRYTYYFAFFFTLALDLLFETHVLTMSYVAIDIKAFMLGASIPTLLVWGLDLLSNHYINKMLAKVA